jgi:hypothetical protein
MIVEEENTRQSRLFVILAIALIGLLVLGLLGIGGVFVIRQNLQEQAARSRVVPTLSLSLPEPSPTFTPIKPVPTNTPAPTPTNTPVVASNNNPAAEQAAVGNGNSGGQPAQDVTLPKPGTRTPGGAPAATPGAVPQTGLGALEAVLIAVGLIGVLVVARRLRMSL